MTRTRPRGCNTKRRQTQDPRRSREAPAGKEAASRDERAPRRGTQDNRATRPWLHGLHVHLPLDSSPTGRIQGHITFSAGVKAFCPSYSRADQEAPLAVTMRGQLLASPGWDRGALKACPVQAPVHIMDRRVSASTAVLADDPELCAPVACVPERSAVSDRRGQAQGGPCCTTYLGQIQPPQGLKRGFSVDRDDRRRRAPHKACTRTPSVVTGHGSRCHRHV